MRDDDHDPSPGAHAENGAGERVLAFGIEIGIGLVEHYQEGVAVERAGERDPLLLTGGQRGALLADLGLVSGGQIDDEVVHAGGLSRGRWVITFAKTRGLKTLGFDPAPAAFDQVRVRSGGDMMLADQVRFKCAQPLAHAAAWAFLDVLAVQISHRGRREEALTATQEAVDIRRRLARSRPDAFLADLARSLGVLGNALAAAERHAEAAAAAHEGLMTFSIRRTAPASLRRADTRR